MNQSILSIIEKIASTSSRNSKIDILESHSDSELLKQIFFRALTPYEQFYIKKIPSYSHLEVKYDLDYFLNQIGTLSSRIITGHAASNMLVEMLSHMTPEDAVVGERIIKKDLRCGVQAASVNKIWEELVPIFPVLLAEPYSYEASKNIRLPAIVQLKEDGVRVNVVCRGGKIVIHAAKSGNIMKFHGVFDQTFIKLAADAGRDVVFDGEAVVLDAQGNILPRKKGNGIINKSILGTISEKEAQSIRIRLWDIIPCSDFDKRYCATPYEQRLSELMTVVGPTDIHTSKCEIVETHIMDDWDKIHELFYKVLGLKKEGLMVKDGSAPWEDRRISLMLKLKAQKECELEVIELIPGENKYTGMVGSLRCADADRKLWVNLGSGLSDHERATLDESTVGKIVTARFNEVIQAENSEFYSLYLARLVEIRLDKQVADTLEVIMKI